MATQVDNGCSNVKVPATKSTTYFRCKTLKSTKSANLAKSLGFSISNRRNPAVFVMYLGQLLQQRSCDTKERKKNIFLYAESADDDIAFCCFSFLLATLHHLPLLVSLKSNFERRHQGYFTIFIVGTRTIENSGPKLQS